MSYLEPPPLPSPVIVTKDVGGYVDQYRMRTAQFRAENREVRLHECRSACTLALSLPNVCVYPTSLLKFHQAYNPETRVANLDVSDELWRSYPSAVRARLGTLTREYKVIKGEELIALGIRDCSAPRDEILMAKVRPAPVPARAPEATVMASLGDRLASFVSPTPFEERTGLGVEAARSAADRPARDKPVPDEAKTVPEPPPRPTDLAQASGTAIGNSISFAMDVPLPPRRPATLATVVPMFRRPIAGSQPILQPGFVALASLR